MEEKLVPQIAEESQAICLKWDKKNFTAERPGQLYQTGDEGQHYNGKPDRLHSLILWQLRALLLACSNSTALD